MHKKSFNINIETLLVKIKKINHNNYGLFFGADEGT